MKWISVKDRLPEDDEKYLIYPPMWGNYVVEFWPYDDHNGIKKNSFYLESEYNEITNLENVTHWMPLPDKPQGGE